MDMRTPRNKQRGECRFCSLLAGAHDTFDSMWLSDTSYRALVSVGAMVPGWTLICPVNHVANLSEEFSRVDFWRFAEAAAHILEERYGACAFFEHGAANEESLTGCGVGHAHAHLVPLGFSLESEARLSSPELAWQDCTSSEIASLSNGREYLFVAEKFDGAESIGSIAILQDPISQFFRRLIARKLGIADLYDYKKYPMLDMAAQSAEELRRCANLALAKA